MMILKFKWTKIKRNKVSMINVKLVYDDFKKMKD
jgi:hypothetical protein